MSQPPKEQIPIAVRAYVQPARTALAVEPKGKKEFVQRKVNPSVWTLIFDTETTTDASQKLRFGTYQIRKEAELMEEGLFFDSEVLSPAEQSTLCQYAKKHALAVLDTEEFIEKVFFYIGYENRGHVVGFNLPFDISRLAIAHNSARGTMLGGFTFRLSDKFWRPNVQIKHLSSRDSIIRFAALKKLQSKGDVKKKRRYPTRRGFFVDVKTAAAALTSASHTLESLARHLGVTSQKHHAEHGKRLSNQYIDYARQDTQATWECFVALQQRYEMHLLTETPFHKIHTEASLGKAYLKEMHIKPWREVQPDFLPELLGIIASSYYGGRSEVKIRRKITQVLYCDFVSMYPTVCTLMGLWNFVVAQGIEWADCTKEARRLLKNITLADLQRQQTWQALHILVQVQPQNEIYPVRARYGDDAQYTIGANHLESEHPLWYTLADCIAAKLLSGKTPCILKAVKFTPKANRTDCKPSMSSEMPITMYTRLGGISSSGSSICASRHKSA